MQQYQEESDGWRSPTRIFKATITNMLHQIIVNTFETTGEGKKEENITKEIENITKWKL